MQSSSRTHGDFRRYVREWLKDNAPTGTLTEVGNPEQMEDARAFMRALFAAGLSGLTWPTEYGGQGLDQQAQRIFDEEARLYPLPMVNFGPGLAICGPSIVDLGTAAQKENLLPSILDGSAVWCQLFSEPGAGSDIANVQTRAVGDGDEYVVNGQKIWTSVGHLADWALLIARTDPSLPRHKGLTMFALDMRTPGVTVRALRDVSGVESFSEVFLDDVRLPRDAIVGELNGAWEVIRVGLAHERLAMGAGLGSDGPRGMSPLAATRLVDTAMRVGIVEESWPELLDVALLERSTELLAERTARLGHAGTDPGVRGSVSKVMRGRLEIIAGELAGRLSSDDLRGYGSEWSPTAKSILSAWKFALGGGTNEIQFSIIGERALGLPREPEAGVARVHRPRASLSLLRPLPGQPEVDDFRSSIRNFAVAASSREKIRTVVDDAARSDVSDWQTAARQLGVQGLLTTLAPNDDASEFDVAVTAVEELARCLTPGPYLPTIFAGFALGRCSAEGFSTELEGVVAGSTRYAVDFVSLGLDRTTGRPVTVSDGRLTGTIEHVVGTTDADRLLTVVWDDGIPLLCVVRLDAPEVRREPLASFDVTRPSQRLVLSGAPAVSTRLSDEQLALLQDTALILVTAEQTGLMRRVLEADVDYLLNREAFGRVVGSFQSVKHQLAEFYCQLELSVSQLEHAVEVYPRAGESRSQALAAFCFASAAASHVTSEGLRIIGAIGFTWEHDAHLYARRARVNESIFGNIFRLRRELARGIGF